MDYISIIRETQQYLALTTQFLFFEAHKARNSEPKHRQSPKSSSFKRALAYSPLF